MWYFKEGNFLVSPSYLYSVCQITVGLAFLLIYSLVLFMLFILAMKFLLLIVIIGVAESLPGVGQKRQGANYNPKPPPPDAYTGGEKKCRAKCVPYFQCSPDNTVITDGQGIIQIRTGGPGSNTYQSVGGGGCPGLVDVCCGVDAPIPTIPPKPEPVRHKCGNTRGKLTSEGTYDTYDFDVRIHLDKNKHNFENIAQFASYPWMAAVLQYQEYDKDGNKYPAGQGVHVFTCGGSLIDEYVVLTAAHCLQKLVPETTVVRLGEWDTQTENENPHYTHQDHKARKFIIHPKFNSSNLWDDVALIFLHTPAQLDYHVDTICLPDEHQIFDHQTCYASGWGKDYWGQEGVWQAVLKEIDLPMVPREQCQLGLRNTVLGCNFCLHDSFVCAGGVPGKDTCEGDGGGALVCLQQSTSDPKGFYVQTGIVAWGISCGTETPGVYVDVSRFVPWITHHVNYELGADIFPPLPIPYEYKPNYINDQCVHDVRNPYFQPQFPPGHQCARKHP